ncbi:MULTISPECIES: hypothetical protein [unclassified Micromonospora]|uniref:hypothetical protein n=1 Tax=unclassified Micromonospora TaxID=2617518 RepID=UPI0036457ECB
MTRPQTPAGVQRPWEVGSAFPLVLPTGSGGSRIPQPARLYGSGRQALMALLQFGIREYGWTAVHVPAYYCPPVAHAMAGVLPVLSYDAGPAEGTSPDSVRPTEVVLAVSYFGIPPTPPGNRGAALIVDATHDPVAPWLVDLPTEYVVASLRKTLPLPDGGMLFSPAGHALPGEAPTDARHAATAARALTAMCIKAAYLAGGALAKESYLALYRTSEQDIGAAGVSGPSRYTRLALDALPLDEFRRRRLDNAARLAHGLPEVPGLAVRVTPFGVICEFDAPAVREAVRQGLVARDIYPAVLWDLPENAPARQRAYSQRMLHLVTDFRYRPADMDRVAVSVRDLAERLGSTACAPTGPEVVTHAARPATTRGSAC